MRRLVTITPARLANRSMPHAAMHYGPTWNDLCRFISVKYRIDIADVRPLIRDVFKYIDAEVMRNGESFHVPNFGTFRYMNGGESRWGTEREWMKLDRVHSKNARTTYSQKDDPEDAGPRE